MTNGVMKCAGRALMRRPRPRCSATFAAAGDRRKSACLLLASIDRMYQPDDADLHRMELRFGGG